MRTKINSNIDVKVIDNRKNGGNYKWQIEKLDVILDFFNDDFFSKYPNVKIEVIVNSKEVFPRLIVDDVKIFPDYIRFFKAFSKSKKEMIEEMNYMVEMMNNMFNNNMEENNMSNEMINNVDLFNVYVKDVLVNEYNNACDSAIDACFDSENEYECGGFNYDYDIRKMWVDYCTNVIDVYDMDRDDLYNYYDENSDMFISVDDLDEVVDGFENTDDVGYGECLIWVKNPCYIAEINDTPCLDYDIDRGIERVADTIKNYLENYMPSYLDGFGDCVVTIYWDEFDEEDMKMLIEDDIFALSVRDVLYENKVIESLDGFLVYDDGVYVTVDYDKMFNKVA